MYYDARYYDPDLGRFLQADTYLDGMNRYTYCGNNPIRYNDPSGFAWVETESGDRNATEKTDYLIDTYIDLDYESWQEAADANGIGHLYNADGSWAGGDGSLEGMTILSKENASGVAPGGDCTIVGTTGGVPTDTGGITSNGVSRGGSSETTPGNNRRGRTRGIGSRGGYTNTPQNSYWLAFAAEVSWAGSFVFGSGPIEGTGVTSVIFIDLSRLRIHVRDYNTRIRGAFGYNIGLSAAGVLSVGIKSFPSGYQIIDVDRDFTKSFYTHTLNLTLLTGGSYYSDLDINRKNWNGVFFGAQTGTDLGYLFSDVYYDLIEYY